MVGKSERTTETCLWIVEQNGNAWKGLSNHSRVSHEYHISNANSASALSKKATMANGYRAIIYSKRLIVYILLLLTSISHGFVARRISSTRNRPFYSEENDASLFEELKARQEEVQNENKALMTRWRKAKCQSEVKVVLGDWVRRLDASDKIIALGSAQSHVHVASLETGQVLAQTPDSAVNFQELTDIESDLRLLFGAYDGGGTIAIAVEGILIAHAHRGGNVDLWIFDPKQKNLISQGSMAALEGVLVTALQLDEEYLYVGTADGRVMAFSRLEDIPLALQAEPEHSWEVLGTVLSLAIESPIDCVVATTSHGSVEIFSLEDGKIGSFLPPFDSSDRRSSAVNPISACFIQHKDSSYSVACGGNDGSMYVQPLNMKDDAIDTDRPFIRPLQQIRPRHFGPVKSLVSPIPDVLVSGGQDGTIRAWDPLESQCLYQFVGYKVWLGSVWSDGKLLVSDGSDNTVIVHDFTVDPSEKK